MTIAVTWVEMDPGRLWRSLDGRYAIVAVTLPERPPRTVYQVRKVDMHMVRAYPDRGDLGFLLEESPWLSGAKDAAERDAFCDAHADQRDVPADLPAVALRRFFWPISKGIDRAGLAVVRDGARLVARVVGMTRRDDDGFEPYVRAEIDLTELGVHAPAAENTTTHGPDPCPGCGAVVGAAHGDGCGIARCMATGGQRLMCDMAGGRPTAVEVDGELLLGGVPDGHDCGQDVWTGRWPGHAECEEFGWWCQDRSFEGLGFVPCPPGAPGAIHDLNRLDVDARWDAAAGRWVRR